MISTNLYIVFPLHGVSLSDYEAMSRSERNAPCQFNKKLSLLNKA